MNSIEICPHRLTEVKINDQEKMQHFMPCDFERCPFYRIDKHLNYTEYTCTNPLSRGNYRVADFDKPNEELLEGEK